MVAQVSKTAKEVQVIARSEFKSDTRKVVYKVLSSDGKSEYYTSLFNGKACSCTCPATKPCYHMTQLEAREQVRKEQETNARCNREMASDSRFL